MTHLFCIFLEQLLFVIILSNSLSQPTDQEQTINRTQSLHRPSLHDLIYSTCVLPLCLYTSSTPTLLDFFWLCSMSLFNLCLTSPFSALKFNHFALNNDWIYIQASECCIQDLISRERLRQLSVLSSSASDVVEALNNSWTECILVRSVDSSVALSNRQKAVSQWEWPGRTGLEMIVLHYCKEESFLRQRGR